MGNPDYREADAWEQEKDEWAEDDIENEFGDNDPEEFGESYDDICNQKNPAPCVQACREQSDEDYLSTDHLPSTEEDAFYIVNDENDICAGPYPSTRHAKHDIQRLRWYDPMKHDIQFGFEDSNGKFSKLGEGKREMKKTDEAYDFNNGYYDRHQADEEGTYPDFAFPSGADSPVLGSTGAAGAHQGDNPEQKKMAVTEDIFKEMVYKYRSHLKESSQRK